ncbi:MAG: zf-HC2 domain-containing protein [Bacteroides sp.]|nr:zf-HC2 domain-containing protein [Bacteroides sp.]MCM1550378.1 zf-HC2 domain-containing protein [Clostridium sp.]
MNKLSCDVIRDLIPAYVDEICSADTRKIVEQHLQECRDCKNLVEMIRETEIVSVASDAKEIDYMRGIRRYLTGKTLICMGILLLLAAVGIGMSIQNYGMISLPFYYILAPVWMLLSYLVASDSVNGSRKTKWKGIMTGIGGVLLLYSIWLEFLIIFWLRDGLSGMQPEQLASALRIQLFMLILLQAVSFVVTWMISMKTGNSHIILTNMNIMGCCLSLSFASMLRGMSSLENFVKIRDFSLIVILLEGIVMTGILLILNQRKRKKVASVI